MIAVLLCSCKDETLKWMKQVSGTKHAELSTVDTVLDLLEYTNGTPGVYGARLASISYLDPRL